MCKDGNGGVKAREFAVVVPLTLPSLGRVEDEIKKFSRTLTPKITTLHMWHWHTIPDNVMCLVYQKCKIFRSAFRQQKVDSGKEPLAIMRRRPRTLDAEEKATRAE